MVTLAVEPFDVYWSQRKNKYEVFITVLLEGVAVFWSLPIVYIPDQALRYLNILRLLRLFAGARSAASRAAGLGSVA